LNELDFKDIFGFEIWVVKFGDLWMMSFGFIVPNVEVCCQYLIGNNVFDHKIINRNVIENALFYYVEKLWRILLLLVDLKLNLHLRF